MIRDLRLFALAALIAYLGPFGLASAAGAQQPARVGAQQPGRVPVVGMLVTHPPIDDQVVESVRIGLRQYGYEDGRNIKLEVRTALGRVDRVPALAEELVQLRVDVIVLVNEVALRAVRQATTTIPIVMVGYTDDPVDVEVIAQNVDVLVTYGTPAGIAAKNATNTLPIVVAVMGDAVRSRLVESLARPGGNLTGLSMAYVGGIAGCT